MITVTDPEPAVEPAIPIDADGRIHPELIEVSAYLAREQYPAAARRQVLDGLMSGLLPGQLVRRGILRGADEREVRRRLPDSDPELTAWLDDSAWPDRLPYEAELPLAGRTGPCGVRIDQDDPTVFPRSLLRLRQTDPAGYRSALAWLESAITEWEREHRHS